MKSWNERIMKRKKIKWTVITVLFVLFMYSQSMLPAMVSSSESTYALGVVGNFFSGIGLKSIALTEYIIRKLAHFIEYTVFGILFFRTVNVCGFYGIKRWGILVPGSIIIPLVDETIQLFVPGRSGQITDVWLDMSGVYTGFLIIILVSLIIKKLSKR